MKDKQTNVGRFATAKPQVIIAIAMITVIGFAFTALSLTGCDTGSGGGPGDSPQKARYVSTDSNGNKYTLEIEESGGRSARSAAQSEESGGSSARSAAQSGDYFELTVDYTVVGGGNLKLVYSGNISQAQASGATVSLTLDINGEKITITIVGAEMTVISGKIVDPKTGYVVINDPKPTPVTSTNGGDNKAIDGTWINQAGEKWIFNNGSLTAYTNNVESVRGTYSTSGRNITVLFVQFKGSMFGADASQYGFSSSQWYTKQQFRAALIQYMVNAGASQAYAATIVDGQLAQYPIFEPMMGPYTLSNNNNTLNIDGAILTREGSGHTHSWGAWQSNATQHWRECTANDGATTDLANHSGNPCTVCGYATGPSLSLDGTWEREGGGHVVTFSGSTGVFTQIESSSAWQTAVSKGYISVGSEKFRNLTKTGDLTWTGQELVVALGSGNVSWNNVTITLNADGQTFKVNGDNRNWTRTTTYSLDGVWQREGGGHIVTINGSTGVFTQIESSSAWQTAVSKGYISVGSEKFRNLTKTGDLTWTGQELVVALGSGNVSWNNVTITLNADGQTFRIGGDSRNWIRQ